MNELDRPVARAGHRVLLDILFGVKPVVGDAHELRLALGDRRLRRTDDNVLRASAADPAVQRAVGKNDRLRAEVRRCRRDRADDRHQRIRLATVVQCARQFQNFVVGHRRTSIRLGRTRSMLARSAPGASKSRCGDAACMPRLTGLKSGRFNSGLSQTMRRARRRNSRSAAARSFGFAGVVAVADDDHRRARMHESRRVLAVEVLQAFADPRAAAPSGGQQVQAFLRSPRIGIAQRFADAGHAACGR